MAGRRARDLGSFELLLILPIFIAAGWGAAVLSLTIIESGRLERSAWVYSMAKAHKTDEDEAKSVAVRVAPVTIEDETDLIAEGQDIVTYLTDSVPWAFRAFLALNPQERKKVSHSTFLPEGPLTWLEPEEFGSFFGRTVKIENPGDDFKDEEWLKQLLWFDVMRKTWDYPFLQALAVPELTRAIGSAGGPIGNIAGQLLADLAYDKVAEYAGDKLQEYAEEKVKDYLKEKFHDALPDLPTL